MGFIGNRKGPRMSEILLKLGPDYFGISMEKLERDIELNWEEEYHGLVDPVYVDKDGRRFLKFYAPNGDIQRFYLEENGYYLEGDIDERMEDSD
jgi:hypothetical protein